MSAGGGSRSCSIVVSISVCALLYDVDVHMCVCVCVCPLLMMNRMLLKVLIVVSLCAQIGSEANARMTS